MSWPEGPGISGCLLDFPELSYPSGVSESAAQLLGSDPRKFLGPKLTYIGSLSNSSALTGRACTAPGAWEVLREPYATWHAIELVCLSFHA